MAKPLIGVTSFRTESGRNFDYLSVTEAYIQALSEAGALPVMIPLGLPDADLEDIRERVDGIVFTGGGDIDPILFNGEPHPTVDRVDPDRDRVEIYLANSAIKHKQPFLGICRGMQVVNVALGGNLYTHVSDQHPNALKHEHWPGHPRDWITHSVQITENTLLNRILGEPIVQVNSLHHQGVFKLGQGLIPSGYAPDGLIEAFELAEHPFALAVQWHPEWLSGANKMPALFKALIQAASNGKH